MKNRLMITVNAGPLPVAQGHACVALLSPLVKHSHGVLSVRDTLSIWLSALEAWGSWSRGNFKDYDWFPKGHD